MYYPITPVPAPRQVRSDAWKPRPMVLRYRAFRDEVGWRKISIDPKAVSILFILPMPRSWSVEKKKKMWGRDHEQTPDLDNLVKALLDSLFKNDSHVSRYKIIQKIWGRRGGIIIPHPGIKKALQKYSKKI